MYNRSDSSSLIEKDIARWIQITAPERTSCEESDNLVWLLKNHPEFRNLFSFRLGRYLSFLGRLLLVITKLFYKPVDTLRFFMPIVGPGLYIRFGIGTIIGAREIGENCWINPGVTIGYKNEQSGLPTIGDNVFIGAGSKILGQITVGDNVIIGANSIVIRDVPSNCTVAGVPARIIKRDGIKIHEPSIDTENIVLT